MRLLVVGAGATGGYFGGRLAQAGRDVTFLVRPARAAQLRASGLEIVSPHGDVMLAPKLVTADQLSEPFDAILLTVKAYALDAALEDMAPAVGPGTMILPTLNGMKHVDVMTNRFGAGAVAGCVCKIAATVDDAGRIVQLARFHDLAYGEMNGASSERIGQLDRIMQGAYFDARLTPAIARAMWEKWIRIAALGGTTCLMRGTVGDILAAQGGLEFVQGFIDEVVAVVSAVGETPSEAEVASIRAMLMEKGSPLTSSMYRDLQKGVVIEADQIIGDLLARARQAGLTAPLLAAAYTSLSAYQNRLAPSAD
jgi:2-dehydropantoate 2-reductase